MKLSKALFHDVFLR